LCIRCICARTLCLFVQGHYAYLYKDITPICARTLRLFVQGHYAYLCKDITPICARTLRLFVQGHYAYLYKDITHICTRTLCPFLSGGFLDSQKRHFRIRLSSGFRLALNDIFAVLEFYAMYIGSSIRTFRNNVSFRSSRTKHLCNLDHC